MIIVTQVEADGRAFGYKVVGGSTPLSTRVFGPSFFDPLIGTISGDRLLWGSKVKNIAVLTAHHTMRFNEIWSDGDTPRALLNPVWRLVDAERASTLPLKK